MSLIHKSVETLRKQKKIRSEVAFTQFGNLMDVFEENDRVYVATPMSSNTEYDSLIFETWRNRTRRDNTLTHLSGVGADIKISDNIWGKQQLDNYLSPEDIEAARGLREMNNEFILKKAEHVIDFITAARRKGNKPRINQVLMEAEKFTGQEHHKNRDCCLHEA